MNSNHTIRALSDVIDGLNLTKEEKQTAEMRLEGKTLKDIGNTLGISPEATRQIEAKACRKLRYLIKKK